MMKAKEIEALESYFITENEHWNCHTFDILCKTIERVDFKNPETPLQLFSTAIQIFTENHETPLKAVNQFFEEVEKEKLSNSQKRFVLDCIINYIKDTDFEEFEAYDIQSLLRSENKKLKTPDTSNTVRIEEIRNNLKGFMQNELEKLPKTLEGIEPEKRLNIICKLMPFVMPKVETVDCEKGEQSADKSFFNL